MVVTNQVKERPILFSGAMIQAILEGRKTQTRRIIKLPSWSTQNWEDFEVYENNSVETICASTGCSADILCPYGKKGDRLWVRETWALSLDSTRKYIYKADDVMNPFGGWKPSIHMPRSASRINLLIKNIRVEQLQEISEEDAIAEGIERTIATQERFGCRAAGMVLYRDYSDDRLPWRRGYESPIDGFKTLWDSINSDRGYSWDSDPFVWVVEFEREAA